VPVGKEPGLVLSNSIEPGPSLIWPVSQAFELLHCPSDQMAVDAQCEGVQLGAVEGPVIRNPASDLGIDLPGEVGQVRAAATVEVPVPDLLALRLLCAGAHSRRETHEESSSAARSARPKGIAKKIEAGVLRLSPAVAVLAVDDLRLFRMQFESKGPKPLGESDPQTSGLCLGVAVDYRIIRVALEGTARILPVHPSVERIVHEEVSE
jgi:hypothetical protein